MPDSLPNQYQPGEQGTHAEDNAEALAPVLNPAEKRDVIRRTALRAAVVHEAIRNEGEGELRRPIVALTWSGLAAGLTMGFSLIAEGLLRSHLPAAPWRELVSKLGYSVGFLGVILGRQQLFTENTVTVIIPLLARRDRATLVAVVRLWVVVLVSNLLGAAMVAALVGTTGVFPDEVKTSFNTIGLLAATANWSTVFLRAIFAGWLIAMMIWMLPAAEGLNTGIIVMMTYLVGLGHFPHVIAGSIEVLFVVFSSGQISAMHFLSGYLAPTLLGNVVGGVALVAFFNHAQVVAEHQ